MAIIFIVKNLFFSTHPILAFFSAVNPVVSRAGECVYHSTESCIILWDVIRVVQNVLLLGKIRFERVVCFVATI